MTRQKGVLLPRMKKGIHPDVQVAAIRMLVDEETARLSDQEILERFVYEWDEKYGGPVWYIP